MPLIRLAFAGHCFCRQAIAPITADFQLPDAIIYAAADCRRLPFSIIASRAIFLPFSSIFPLPRCLSADFARHFFDFDSSFSLRR
jgi:hypothetical protein